MTEENFAWVAGIDWSSERHQPCLVDPQGRIRLESTRDKPAVTVRQRRLPDRPRHLECVYWTGVELAAAVSMYSLIITAKRNDDDPRVVLDRIGDHPASDLGEPFWLA